MAQGAAVLSRELRAGSGGHLTQRRVVTALSLTGAASMGLITLYQMGIIKHLPELPLPWFDADAVDASAEAYQYLAAPDATIGLTSYSATLLLAAIGGRDRASTKPWLPLTLAAKVALDVANAARLSISQWTKRRAFCMWCLLAAGATFATMPLVVPEALAAIRALRDKR